MDAIRSLSRYIPFLKKAAPDADPPGTWDVVSGGGMSSITDRNLLEANREWVFVAVSTIAASVAAVRFKAMRYTRNGDDQEVFDGPLVEFLESPGENLTGKDFIYLNTVYKELTGNAFWERGRNRTVRPVVPTAVTPVVSKGKVLAYKFFEDGVQRTVFAKDMLHDRYADPARPWWGVGKLAKIARWADLGLYIPELLLAFFKNGSVFGGFIETEEENEHRVKIIKAGLANDHVGVQNAYKWAVLPKGNTANRAGVNMAELEMGAMEDRYRDKILAGFGVPKTLVGLTTEVNRASAEASEYIYAKYTVKPIVDDLVEFLNTQVVPLLDPSGKLYFDYDEFVPEDATLKLQMTKDALAGQQYMTVNEVRANAGLPPVKGGDVLYGNPYLLPLGTPAPAPGDTDDEEDEDESEPQKALPKRARRAFGREKIFDKAFSKAAQFLQAKRDADLDAANHKAFVGRVLEHEKLLAAKLRDFNNRQERDVTLRLKHIVKAVDKNDLFDLPGEVSVLVDIVGPLLKSLMLEQGAQEYLDQAFPGAFDASLPRISDIVNLAAKRVAKSYNKTTRRLLAETLDKGISEGEDLAQLTARVRAVYEFSNTVRADMVANTETFYIANEGSREAYRQSGVVKTMRWYTAADERVCEFCGPENGKVIGVNDVFYSKGHTLKGSDGGTLDLNYRTIDVPPLHTNCRCFIRPETIDIG